MKTKIFEKSDYFEFLSFGGGVQSVAVLCLIIEGKLPKPDLIIMADTGAEMPQTEEYIEKYVKPLCEENNLEFIIVQSSRGTIIEDYFANNAIPNVANRSCTQNFKVYPVRRYIRKIVGSGNSLKAYSWLGISTDEKNRKSKSDRKWVQNRYPLLDLEISRKECKNIIQNFGLPLPIKSGCYMCPFQNIASWMNLRDNEPQLFKISVELEQNMFHNRPERKMGFLKYPKKLGDLQNQGKLSDWAELFDKYGESPECSSGSCFL